MPRTDKQQKSIREKSKELIMDTALKLFSYNGFHATSISMIAKEAKIATGLIYNYFESKEQLLNEIIKTSLDAFSSNLYPHVLHSFENKSIISLIDAVFDAIKEQRESWRLYIRILLEPSLQQFGKQNVQFHLDHIGKVFEAYFKNKNETNPEDKAKMLVALVHGALLNYILTDEQDSFDLVKNMINEYLL